MSVQLGPQNLIGAHALLGMCGKTLLGIFQAEKTGCVRYYGFFPLPLLIDAGIVDLKSLAPTPAQKVAIQAIGMMTTYVFVSTEYEMLMLVARMMNCVRTHEHAEDVAHCAPYEQVAARFEL